MWVLFDTRDRDTAVNAMEHGKRIAATLMDETLGTAYFRHNGQTHSHIHARTHSHAHARMDGRTHAPR